MSENGCTNCEENTPLTGEEVDAIRESWAIVWSNKKENGIKIFIKLFTQHPEAQEKFKDFRGLAIEDVKVHKKLRAHALSVIYALKSFIDSMEDTETMEQLVRKIANSHFERTVTATQIQWLLPVFTEVLEEIEGENMKDIYKSAWTKLFNAIQKLWQQEHDEMSSKQT